MGAGRDQTQEPYRNRGTGCAGQTRPSRDRFAYAVVQEASLPVGRHMSFRVIRWVMKRGLPERGEILLVFCCIVKTITDPGGD